MPASPPGPLPVPGVRFLTRITVEVADVFDVGPTDVGHRRIASIAGGTVTGEDLSGVVLPGGADWQVELADGAVAVDTRYTLRTDDGALVYVQAVGLRTGPREVLEALAAGDEVEPGSYYYRTTATFETADPGYRWLSRLLTVCSVARAPTSVAIDVYVVT